LADRAIFGDGGATGSYAVTFSASENVGNTLFNATTNDANWVLNGSTWTVTNSFIVSQGSSATSTSYFRNGTIKVTNGGSATFQVGNYASAGNGMFTMLEQAVGSAPTLIVDDFLLSSNALFSFESGTLTTQHGSTLDGGTNAIVTALGSGAGTNTATWNMLGGVNTVTSLLTNGVTALGYNPDGSSVFNMIVSGPGTVWNVDTPLLAVGWNASANLVISNGAIVNCTNATLSANGTTSSNNAAIVTGTGSQWNIDNNSRLIVGNDDSGNTLTIANGGVVNAGTICYIGSGSGGSSNNSVLVTGAGSQLNLNNSGTSTLGLGYATANNTLIISNGASVSAGIVYVGMAGGNSNSMNNTLVATGPTTTLNATWDVSRVGNHGPGNTMIISSGAVFNCFGLRIGDDSNACYNTLIVNGATLSSGGLFNVGGYGSNNTVIVTNGGNVACTSTSARMSNNSPSSDNNAIIIDGTNSVLNMLGGYVVGNAGGGDSVTVRNGGVWNTGSSDFAVGINSYVVNVGNNATLNCNNNSITVTGPGSRWVNYDTIQLYYGTNQQVVVSNGGAIQDLVPTNFVTGGNGSSASNSAGHGITVDGAGSYLAINTTVGELRIGQYGLNHFMRISNGGVVSNAAGMVSNHSTNTVVQVTGAGSLWYNATGLRVGNGSAACFNTLSISNGGQVVNVGTITSLGGTVTANGNVIVIDGVNSSLYSTPSLTVGSQGTTNAVWVQNGGQMYTDVGAASGASTIGGNPQAASNTVTVTGPGSRWVEYQGIAVGPLGSFNQLIVTNGGEVDAYGGMSLSYAATNLVVGSSNSVLVLGGTLAMTNTTDSGILTVGKSGVTTGGLGTFTLSGGTVYVDQLIITNGASSVFNFKSGVLNVLSSQVANASTFVVGDASDAAQLNLWSKPDFPTGTSHTYANGLMVTNNGTLSGIGTIIGNVTLANGAAWSPGSSVGTQSVVGAVSLNTFTSLNYDLGAPGTAGDLITITGNLTLAGVLNVHNLGGFGAGDYTLMTYSGSLINNGVAFGSMPGGFTYSIIAGGGTVVLQVVASGPPPGSYAAWAQAYFGSTNCAHCGPLADPTGDGMSNTNKYMAGF